MTEDSGTHCEHECLKCCTFHISQPESLDRVYNKSPFGPEGTAGTFSHEYFTTQQIKKEQRNEKLLIDSISFLIFFIYGVTFMGCHTKGIHAVNEGYFATLARTLLLRRAAAYGTSIDPRCIAYEALFSLPAQIHFCHFQIDCKRTGQQK